MSICIERNLNVFMFQSLCSSLSFIINGIYFITSLDYFQHVKHVYINPLFKSNIFRLKSELSYSPPACPVCCLPYFLISKNIKVKIRSEKYFWNSNHQFCLIHIHYYTSSIQQKNPENLGFPGSLRLDKINLYDLIN